MPKEFQIATKQFECDDLAYWTIRNTVCCMWQKDKEVARGFSKTCERGKAILKLHRPTNDVFTESELKAASVSSSIFPSWFRTLFMKKQK